MPSYTFTAFKWTGNHYNAVYNDSHSVTFNDDDASYGGGSDSSETVSIDGGADLATASSPYSIDVGFTDTGGGSHVETFYFFNAGGAWYFVPGPDSRFTEGAKLGSYRSHTMGWEYIGAVCFASGARILTKAGYRTVELLSERDLVWTETHGFQRPRQILRRRVAPLELWANPKLAPVRIRANALGPGAPERCLWVSRQHRMLIASEVAERMFGAPRVLVAAIRLTKLDGVEVDRDRTDFAYHHLVFAEHQIVCAEGALTESFFPGRQALKALPAPAAEEFRALFPQTAIGAITPKPAAHIPDNGLQKRFARRHAEGALTQM